MPLVNMVMAIFSGLVCFSVIGNMAHSNGVPFIDVINGGLKILSAHHILAFLKLIYRMDTNIKIAAALN